MTPRFDLHAQAAKRRRNCAAYCRGEVKDAFAAFMIVTNGEVQAASALTIAWAVLMTETWSFMEEATPAEADRHAGGLP